MLPKHDATALRWAVLTALLTTACGDEETLLPARLAVLEEATPTECPNGGQVVVSGTDENGDGQLTGAEVATRRPVCAGPTGPGGEPGPDGTTARLRVSEEPAGANCAEGGVRIEAGVDADGDGVLGDDEVEQTSFACDGLPGARGRVTLVRTRVETGVLCENGGIIVELGVDLDDDGVLDDEEVTSTDALCDGGEGETTLTSVLDEPPGPNCQVGGSRIDVGIDLDDDGVLDASEIGETSYACNPIQTAVRVSPELAATSTACPGVGGSRIERGPDVNANGQLDPSEVVDTVFVCSGAEGERSLVAVTPEPAGTSCALGGNRIDSGVDLDGDGTLDPSEVVSTAYVCDGPDGPDGSGGNLVRVGSEPAGANCPQGGARIETGPDANGNGALDDAEVTSTTFACRGVAQQTLVETQAEPPGANCTNGGIRIVQGVDDDLDGVLDAGEIDATQFVCDTAPSSAVPFFVTTESLPDTFTVSTYDQEITAVGGTGGSYQWSVISGALPPGFALDATGTPSTRLSGANPPAGTYTFTVRVTDFFRQSAEATYTITVRAPPCSPGDGVVVGETLTTLTAPSSFGSGITGVAADDQSGGFIYVIDSGGSLERFRKDASLEEDVLALLPGISGGDINSVHVIGSDIFLTNDSTSCSTDCIRRISTDRGQTFSVQDLGDFSRDGGTNDALQGVAVTGTTLWTITNDPVEAQLWSIDLGAASFPTTATLAATLSTIDTCNGLGVDDRWFYTACDDIGNGSEGLVRIDRTTFATEPVASLTLSISSGSWGNVEVVDRDGDGAADVAYVQGDNNSSTTGDGATYYVCSPSGAVPAFSGSFGAGTADDEGLGYDPSTNSLWQIDESSTNIFRFD